MDEKVLLSLVSVVVGWFMAQGTSMVKGWWSARKLRKGLLTELEDIQDQLKRVVLIQTRQLQISALNGMEPTASLPVENLFFRQYFKDAFPHLNREQRISYQLIHASLGDLNRKNDNLAKFAEESYSEVQLSPKDDKTLQTIQAWGDRVLVTYKAARILRWHIAYHLQNPDRPKFDIMGPMHESYVKFKHELEEEAQAILDKATSFKRENFERIYDPAVFAGARNDG